MIMRDESGLIVQHRKKDPSYKDGGDSSRSTGIMATFGSRLDKGRINLHFKIKGFVRHPYQSRWNDPKNFSRDQLICLASGLREAHHDVLLRFHFRRQYWKGICDNGDLLGPEFYWHLILCGRLRNFYWFAPIGYIAQILHIIFMTKIRPDLEQNQTICMAHTSGLLKLWCRLHPDWKGSLVEYWGGWRDQLEIAQFLIDDIERKISNYNLN